MLSATPTPATAFRRLATRQDVICDTITDEASGELAAAAFEWLYRVWSELNLVEERAIKARFAAARAAHAVGSAFEGMAYRERIAAEDAVVS